MSWVAWPRADEPDRPMSSAGDARLAADIEADRLVARFAHRSALILDATVEGLIDYLTCPACRALVPIPPGPSWPDTCPRCGRCV